jgi:CheY-like chemotaxis protein
MQKSEQCSQSAHEVPLREALRPKLVSVASTPKRHILIIEDDSSVRETMALVLASVGYEVSTAKDGLDALQQFKATVPDLLLCDLEMPRMSGFELLSIVRRRFPEIGVVAMSGAFDSDVVPDGVVADAFYVKGGSKLDKLFSVVAEVMHSSARWVNAHVRELTPVWAPCISKDASGAVYALIACPECLRSFALAVPNADAIIMDTKCVFCLTEIRYMPGSSFPGLPSRNANDIIVNTESAGQNIDGKLRAAAKGR